MSKKCIKCGAELEDGAVFCDECGTQQTVEEGVVNKIPSQSAQPTAQQVNNTYQQRAVSDGQARIKNSGIGIASFVLGIVSICTFGCLFITEILGIIFGIIALNDKKAKHGLPIAGLVTSAIALLILIIIMLI